MKKRFYDISILRVMAMLLVVYYHCICPYYVWSGIDSAGFVNPIYEKVCFDLTGIHMPLFFLIAGYLFGYKRLRGGYTDSRAFLIGKAKRVLVPYVLVGLLLLMLRQVKITGILNGYNSHLWFLMTIFECYAVGKLVDFVLWDNMKTKVAVCLFAFLACIAGYFVVVVLGSRFTNAFFYYLTGMIIATLDVEVLRRWRKTIILGGGVLAVAVVALAVLSKYMIFSRSLCIPLVFCVFLAFRTSPISDTPQWFKHLDTCSMGIYIVHHIIIQSVNRTDFFHPLMVEHCYVYPTIQFVVVFLLSWAVVSVLRRYKFAQYFGL